MLIILVLVNIFVFGLKWYFLVKLWTGHLEFFTTNAFLYTDMPNVLYQFKLIVIIILHDLVYKFITYFYFVRYKPLFMPLTFWTLVDLIQSVFLVLIPLIWTAYCQLRMGFSIPIFHIKLLITRQFMDFATPLVHSMCNKLLRDHVLRPFYFLIYFEIGPNSEIP